MSHSVSQSRPSLLKSGLILFQHYYCAAEKLLGDDSQLLQFLYCYLFVYLFRFIYCFNIFNVCNYIVYPIYSIINPNLLTAYI